jgi:hypothetical protein
VVHLTNFTHLPPKPFNTFIKGVGRLEPAGETLRLVNGQTTADYYSNAQIDDYQGLARREFLWQPPLYMRVRASFSHPDGILKGTAGFGFWNDPFLMTGWRLPSLPRAVWFFYASPPSNMKLDLQTPGFGWKAATLDAWRWPFPALLPFAPLAVPLLRLRSLYWLCWPFAQRAMQVSEALISVRMTEWHTYELCWGTDQVRFVVDEQTVLHCRTSPHGPLGFVLWLDNQYMVATPWGQFQYGLLTGPAEQWLAVSELTIRAERP